MSGPVPHAALRFPDRLFPVIEGLCRAVASRAAAERALAPLLLLVWGRLRRMAVRFGSFTGRVRVQAAVRTAAARAVETRPRPPASREKLPRECGWLLRLVPEAACYGGQLQAVLSEPGMAELLARAPRARRLLRPLCRMLALDPGPEIMPPLARRKGSRRKRDAGDVARDPISLPRVQPPRPPRPPRRRAGRGGLPGWRWRIAKPAG